MTIKEFFSFRQNKFFWVNLIAMIVVVALVLFGVLKGLDIYTRHGEAVVVPNVKGMGVTEAEKMFRNQGLTCIVSDSSYVKNLPAGCILEHNPAAGQKVKEGRTIYLTINTLNVPLQIVPDVADNSSMRQAQARLLATGFKLAENEYIAGEKDWVYGVKYKGRTLTNGEKVPVGSTLTLIVGDGGALAQESDSTNTETTGSVSSGDSATDDVEPVGDEAQLYEHFRVVVDRGQEMMRVDKYLFDRLTNASRNRIQKSAEAGFVMANNKPVKSSYKVKPMDVITIMMDRPRYENEVIPEDIPLNIVYEDKHLMIVNKPAGLVVHPGHGNYHGTLVNAIAWHMKDNPDYDANDPHVGLVHRIDKDTSGLLVIAKTPDAKTNLGIQFFNKTTKRRYRALVWGIVEQDEGTIIGNIGRNPKDRMQMTVLPDDQGKHAVTHYRVLERLGYVTLVECILETGRTHQIRVHMKHIGHVLFNDERYGGHEILKGTHFSKYKQFVNNCFDTCPRQALHAMTLGFVHPATGEEMYFTSEMPDDMTQLIDKWRGYISNRDLE